MNTEPRVIAMVNQSPDLTDADCELIARACAMQVVRDFTSDWNLGPWNVVFVGKDPKDVPAGALPHYFLPSSDAAGALGYHDVDGQGRPYIRTFTSPTLQNGGTKYSSNNSICVTASHECCEAINDENCVSYCLLPDGLEFPVQGTSIRTASTFMAQEMCDVVESDAYEVTLATGEKLFVSNYVKPDYFDAQKMGQPAGSYDKMGTIDRPFGMSPNAYCILFITNPVSRVIQSFNRTYPEWRLDSKKHSVARFARRVRAAV